MKKSKDDKILSDIEKAQRELNKLLQDINHNGELVLEKSRELDEMIVAFYEGSTKTTRSKK